MHRLIKSVLRRPWLYLDLALLVTLITASFIPRLEFDASIMSISLTMIGVGRTAGSYSRVWFAGAFAVTLERRTSMSLQS